MILQNI